MARIPIAQQDTTQLARPKMTTTSPRARQTQDVSGHAQGLQQLGGTALKVATNLYQKMDSARRYAENAKADVYQTDFMANAMMAEDKRRNADGSPITDLKTDSFQEELKRGRENLPNIYTDKNDLFLAQMKWDKSSVIANNNVIKGRYKNIAVVGDVNTRESISKDINSYAMGNDDALKSIDAKLKEAVRNDIYDAKQAYTLKTQSIDDAKFSRYLYDFNNNPTKAAENVDKYGMSIKQNEKARRLNKETQKIVNENRTLNYSRSMDSVLNLQTTETEIDALVKADMKNPGTGINEKDGFKLKNALTNTIVSAIHKRALIQPDTKRYMQAIDLITFADPKDRINAYRSLIDIYSDNHASGEELVFLKKIADAEEAIDPSKIPEGEWDKGLKMFLRGMVKMWGGAKGDKKIQQDIYDKTKAVIDYVSQGQSVDKAVEFVGMDKVAKAFPDYTSYPKEGKVKMLKNGKMVRIFPDKPPKEES